MFQAVEGFYTRKVCNKMFVYKVFRKSKTFLIVAQSIMKKVIYHHQQQVSMSWKRLATESSSNMNFVAVVLSDQLKEALGIMLPSSSMIFMSGTMRPLMGSSSSNPAGPANLDSLWCLPLLEPDKVKPLGLLEYLLPDMQARQWHLRILVRMKTRLRTKTMTATAIMIYKILLDNGSSEGFEGSSPAAAAAIVEELRESFTDIKRLFPAMPLVELATISNFTFVSALGSNRLSPIFIT